MFACRSPIVARGLQMRHWLVIPANDELVVGDVVEVAPGFGAIVSGEGTTLKSVTRDDVVGIVNICRGDIIGTKDHVLLTIRTK
jgi:hypothetical protein